jgi:hypothetical protein
VAAEDAVKQTLSAEVVAEIRSETVKQFAKWLIALIVLLMVFAATGWWFFIRQHIDDYIAKRGGVPRDAVLAIDSSNACPAGWATFADGNGRVIVGSGRGEGTGSRSFRSIGGAESFKLSEGNVPRHQHETIVAVLSSSLGTAPSRDDAVWGTRAAPLQTSMTGAFGKQDPDPIPTMPPFIALLYCKKMP